VAAINEADLNLVSAFVRVVETGSFTAAARAVGLPTSSVSRRVSALESSLGVRLLQRSTRKIVPTQAGGLYFEKARAALANLDEARTAVVDMSGEIAGPIRFTMGGDNTGLIVSLLAEFIELYPKVQIEVVQTPRRVDLAAEGFDLALRGGPLGDSSLIARRLGRTESGLFASRTYLRKHGRPRSFGDLANHRFVLFGGHRHGQLRLTGPAGDETVRVTGPLVAQDLPTNADAVAAGIGIGLLPDMYFGWLLKGGLDAKRTDFVRLLPEYGLQGSEVSLVSPTTTYEPARVRALRDFLADHLRPLLEKSAAPDADSSESAASRPSKRRRRSRRAA